MQNVIIYSTPACHYCRMAKEIFDKNNIKYIEKDIAGDAEARDEALKKSGQLITPIIDIDGKILAGFDETKIKQALGINK